MSDTVIDVAGLAEAIATIAALEAALGLLVMPLDSALTEHQLEAQQRAPQATRRLHDEIKGVIEPQVGGDLKGILRAGAEYSHFVEFGTRPHFVPESYIGEWAVEHGFGRTGLPVSGRAQPFMRRSESDTLDQAEQRLAKTAEGKIEEFLRNSLK